MSSHVIRVFHFLPGPFLSSLLISTFPLSDPRELTTADFTTSPNTPPTVVQFGVNSPHELSRATTLLAPYVNGIDVNCGCPQSWACAETLGAALMHKRELVADLVKAAKERLNVLGYSGRKTVSVKIRIHKDLRETIDFIKTVEAAGVDFITIHGRMRTTPSSQPVNLEAIKLLASHTTVPTLSNGDVFTIADAKYHASQTCVDGVMAGRGILQNPALFAGHDICPWEAVETFLNKAVKAPIPFKLVIHHLSQMVGTDHQGGTVGGGKGPLLMKEERMVMMECGNMVELIDFLDDIRDIRRFPW